MKPTDKAGPQPRGWSGIPPVPPAMLRAAVVAAAAMALLGGVARMVAEGRSLFPGGSSGWAFAVLTGIIVGHLVALGRDRWWGGTGSGAALTLAVLLLYGWVPAVLVSLAVVVLVAAARRHRWRQALLHGGVDILGIAAAALVLALFDRYPSVEHPWRPDSWTYADIPVLLAVSLCYLAATRVLLWYAVAPRSGGLPTVARTALIRQGLVGVALLGISPLIVVVAVGRPALLPLFAVPLIALDSTLWIARARAEEQLRDPLTGLPNRQWLLERTWTALDHAERNGERAALLLIDLDRFRSVNDTLGHLAGDRLLLQIADRLRLALPRGAEAARLGGDEFAVLLPACDSTTRAQRVARDLVGSPRLAAQPRRADPGAGGQRRGRGLPRPRAGRGGPAAPRGRGDVRGQAGPLRASRSTSPPGTATRPTGWACWAICGARWTRRRRTALPAQGPLRRPGGRP